MRLIKNNSNTSGFINQCPSMIDIWQSSNRWTKNKSCVNIIIFLFFSSDEISFCNSNETINNQQDEMISILNIKNFLNIFKIEHVYSYHSKIFTRKSRESNYNFYLYRSIVIHCNIKFYFVMRLNISKRHYRNLLIQWPVAWVLHTCYFLKLEKTKCRPSRKCIIFQLLIVLFLHH